MLPVYLGVKSHTLLRLASLVFPNILPSNGVKVRGCGLVLCWVRLGRRGWRQVAEDSCAGHLAPAPPADIQLFCCSLSSVKCICKINR